MHIRLLLLTATLVGCTVLLDLEGPPRVIESHDGAPNPLEDGTPDLQVDGAQPDAAPDATPRDAGLSRISVTDLRGVDGTHDGTTWEGRVLRLEPGRQSGTFTSRVFEVETPVRWTQVRWFPWLAYGKALPDGQARDFGYPGGGVDMAANMLLLHLDDETFSGGVVEVSGTGHDVEGTGASGKGVFGGGLTLADNQRLEVDANHPAFRFSDQDFTWMLFVRAEGCEGPSNEVLMGGENTSAAMNGGTHMWLGCQMGDACPGPRGLGGTQRPSAGPPVNGCAAQSYTDGRWHQVALVKRGHQPGRFSWFMDGVQVLESAEVDFAGALFNLDGTLPFTIGAFPTDGYQSHGNFDEVAIWHRALVDDEIERIAARGLARISLQVRACVTADCSDEPPYGPDLVDDFAGNDDVAEAPLALGPSRHIQYRVNLTGRGGLSPELLRVELEGAP